MNKTQFFAEYFLNEVRVIEKDFEEMRGCLGSAPADLLAQTQMKLDRLLVEYTGAMVTGEPGHRVSQKWEEYLKTLPPEPEAVVTTRKEDRK